ncbi:MAG: type IV pili methyl-accepting chemotaxis transducer N-terminal domain-containing protein [Pseudomonadota bacterium]
MLSRRSLLRAGPAAVTCLAFKAHALTDDDDTALMAKRRIDVAGYQRTRVKRIAKAACFARAGVTPAKDLAIIADETTAFTNVLRALRSGNPAIGIGRETKGRVLDALRPVQTLWLPYSERAAALVEGPSIDDILLRGLVEDEPAVHAAMNDAVSAIEQAYGGDDLPLHLAVATNLAGRQRSLSQEIAKDICLIGLGEQTEEAIALLDRSLNVFENTHTALSQGMPMLGIRPPEQPRLVQAYENVSTLFAELKSAAEQVRTARVADAALIAEVGEMADRLLAASDIAVKLYVGES